MKLLVPPDSEMYNFWVTMVLAIVGQSVGLLWTLYRQIKCAAGALGYRQTCYAHACMTKLRAACRRPGYNDCISHPYGS